MFFARRSESSSISQSGLKDKRAPTDAWVQAMQGTLGGHAAWEDSFWSGNDKQMASLAGVDNSSYQQGESWAPMYELPPPPLQRRSRGRGK